MKYIKLCLLLIVFLNISCSKNGTKPSESLSTSQSETQQVPQTLTSESKAVLTQVHEQTVYKQQVAQPVPQKAESKTVIQSLSSNSSTTIAVPTASSSVTKTSSTNQQSLNKNTIVAGILEALKVSAERSIQQLSAPGGFSNNSDIKIPLPQSIESLRAPLEKIRQAELLDNFSATMNQAAEKAIALSPEIIKDTLSSLSIDDAQGILKGGSDAATQLLKIKSYNQLRQAMLPIVQQATAQSGATAAYKMISDKLPASSNPLLGQLSGLAGIELPKNFNLDKYVTDKSLDALFVVLAAEEKKIRENPVERSNELLKSVFGSFAK